MKLRFYMPVQKKKVYIISFLLITLSAISAFFLFNEEESDEKIPDVVDFNFHVRPILSDRCFKCHGPDANKREANLRLDTEEGAFAALKDDLSKHVIVPGDPMASALYTRIISTDTSELMPPPSSNLSLNEREIEVIRKWIKQGAIYKKHWAFIPPVKTKIPTVDEDFNPRNEIDHFVFSKQEEVGLEPNEETSKESLLKRVCMDITGLPPSIEMQKKFLNDQSLNAYEKLVDELLKSKHYGEKMAIPWMDLARYADSHGYQDDGYRTMWPWRDWVIHAFNENYPFSKFITWQLAGDLLPNPTKEMLLATGFNRNHKITQEGGVIDEEYRIEYVTDRTNTFGKAFLSITLECAKCHDHKYDPVSQKDYYSMFAFFNQVPEKGLVGDIQLASPGDPPNMKITTEDVRNIMQFINKKDTAPVVVMVMKDSVGIRPTRLLRRGNYDQPADTVVANTPASILAFNQSTFEKNRLGLAKWMTDPKNPLTARVFVNRIWNEFFGRGIVKTVGDFGMQGELPSHPELLDWLAVDFMENGWNIKRLVKMIVTSTTYRQSTNRSARKLQKDPDNKFLSYYPRLRLSAELQRDLILSAAGILNTEIGGPSVKPYQPKGVWESTTSGRGELARYVQDKGDKLYRRGLYNFIKRTAPPPALLIMDASTRDQCEVTRSRTNTPLQALVLMNDPQILEAARVLAQNTANLNLSEDEKIIRLFQLIICRMPNKKEIEMLKAYYLQEKMKFNQNKVKASTFIKAGEYAQIKTRDLGETAALMQVNQLLFNLDETTVK
ncbi:MAG: PSD1 and planctomycete cytochrome C domain-containing protein [Chitinophagaceae bacterium]